MKWQRAIIIGAVCLIAGAALNVLVAWGCVFWSPLWSSPKTTNVWAGESWHRPSGIGATWGPPVFSQVHAGYGLTLHDHTWVLRLRPDGSGAGDVEPDDPRMLLIVQLVGTDAGWPRRSLRCRNGETSAQRVERGFPKLITPGAYEERLFVTNWFGGRFGVRTGREVPAWPIAGGFAVNTLFYAGVVAALGPLSQTIRRVHRRWRDLCACCGYPIGLSPVCTECGATLPTAPDVPTPDPCADPPSSP